jgi:STE24 endopeptidase
LNEDKSVRYHRLKRRVAVLSICWSAGFLALLLATGGSVAIRRFAAGTAGAPSGAVVVALYLSIVGLLHEAVALPLVFYRSFVLERRYGLSTESASTWAGDHVKAFAISLAIGIAGAEIVYLTMRITSEWWWALSAAAFMLGVVALAKVAPVVLLPLFYRFKPLERRTLTARLIELSARAGVPVLGVYEWGLGEKTRRANAALVGTGRTRRILVSNTLLAHYSDDEIEVILAHEIGHHVNRDITKGLALEALLIVLGFAAAAMALDAGWARLGLSSPSDVAGLPILLLMGGAVSVAATPVVNAISRANEKRADRFALDVTRRPAAFVSAMRRLAAQNLAEERPSAAVRLLFHTHPPIEQRIALAKALE